MRERLKHKYALSEQGVNDMIKAVIIVTIANLAFMVPVGLLYLLASDILNVEFQVQNCQCISEEWLFQYC